MKKLFALLLVLVLGLSLCACGSKEPTVDPEPEVQVDYNAKSEGVMTYEEFEKTDVDNVVTIEGYVQAAQSYWNGAKLYLQDPSGAYFIYCEGDGSDVNISEEDYAKLVANTNYSEGWTGLANGTKVKVTGYKSAWAGEVEIVEVSELVLYENEPKWIADALDLTDKFDDVAALEKFENQKVVFKGLTVESAALYKWDGSGEAGQNHDLYISFTNGTTTYSFTVESYLMYEGSDVYNAVLGLQAGDVVDVEGFLYWYEAPQLHITAINK